MTLVEQLRATGLAMGSWYAPQDQVVLDDDGKPTDDTITVRQYLGWTTDEAKADAAREAGARVTHYNSFDPTCSGWEIAVTEVES